MTREPPYALSVDRFIDASPEKVYEVWTTRTGEWFAPRPYLTPGVEMDLRPGGRFNTVMQAPDGTQMSGKGVFLEVIPARRLVFTDAFAEGWIPQPPFMLAIIEFAPEGTGTRYTATVHHWDAEAMERHEAMGFTTGWSAATGQLADLAEQ
ncbi:SRPBCC family protein [Ancylobacter sp. G4_0304]|uniref:SRPBCC family protein n=1 Tax=Ancylobacter sp. G4_0304 TaxID=3114289 RepID=UPI0039C68507